MKNIFPILLAIGGGVIYHVAQKTMPKQVDPFAAIILAYGVGIGCCAVAWVLMPSGRSWLDSWRASTAAVVMLGVGAALIEIGFLLAYRWGWNISSTSVVVAVTVALILLPIGLWQFREPISWQNAAGIAFCLAGLYLLAQK